MEIKLKDSENSEIKRLKSKYRQLYSHYALFITLGVIWIVSTLTGYVDYHLSILIFISAMAMIKPLLTLSGKVLKRNKSDKNNTLKLSTKIISIGVIFGLSAVFFPFVNNINLFFPSFNIVSSLIFMAIFIALRMNIYLFASLIQLAGGIYLGHTHSDDFMIAGYLGGCSLLGIGVLSSFIGKIIKFRIAMLKKKHKEILNSKFEVRTNLTKDKTLVKEEI